ncbi:Mfa1 family fimbria major subunit [uncultured Prevotella sp.]|uniref:Mfa1 family fimbria major subunit n=1 Tax=uncultured Prevotella sp. TaxID=159272 RepID=UPI002629DB1B|nr:Mfa1 family fimbria major subunit [uncultured Prevotella sp.]
MKNVKNLFGMAVMATALVGCSSNDNLNPNANDNAGKAGEAYASFKINLPTVSGTRAVDPNTGAEFDGGTAAEYEVKNGTILIFDATTDKFVTSVDLGNMNPWTADTDDNGVTTAAIATVKLTGVSTTGSYKALVLLNNNTGTADQKVSLPANTEMTYAKWSKTATNAKADKYLSTAGIFMANAPEYSATSDPKTLVPVAHVCASREQAEAMGATTVYVERGLAKVTMENFAPSYTVADGTYKDATVKIENWKLDVTNKSTFPVHQIGGLSTDFTTIWSTGRFFDNQSSSSFHRVYWGIDPNYSDNTLFNGKTDPAPGKTALELCKDAFNMITNAQVNGDAGQDKPQYCLENTFNLDNMKQGQTTRVVFKAKFIPNGCTAAETFYKIGNNTAIWKKDDLEKQILAVALTAMEITDPTEQAKYGVDLTKGSDISGKAGQHLIAKENITFNNGTATPVTTSQVTDDIVNKINDKLGLKEEGGKITSGISTYLNGEAYYIARIKHFNALTPWNPGEAYESHNDKYLGRYGVLRNNWYSLSVNTVSGLGYPEVPEVKPNVPDDENDKYINVEVKILDWAKRSQSIDL